MTTSMLLSTHHPCLFPVDTCSFRQLLPVTPLQKPPRPQNRPLSHTEPFSTWPFVSSFFCFPQFSTCRCVSAPHSLSREQHLPCGRPRAVSPSSVPGPSGCPRLLAAAVDAAVSFREGVPAGTSAYKCQSEPLHLILWESEDSYL